MYTTPNGTKFEFWLVEDIADDIAILRGRNIFLWRALAGLTTTDTGVTITYSTDDQGSEYTVKVPYKYLDNEDDWTDLEIAKINFENMLDDAYSLHNTFIWAEQKEKRERKTLLTLLCKYGIPQEYTL